MAVTAVTNVGVENVDAAVASVVIPFVAASTQCIVVHVGSQSQFATVLSVVDNFGNVYVRQSGVSARFEIDYPEEGLDKNPQFEDWVSGECWAVKSTGTVANITVTMSTAVRFAVEVQSYAGGSGLGAAGAVALNNVSAPSIALTTTGANSFVSAGFSSVTGLSETATTGTLRGQEYSAGTRGGVDLTVADATVVGLAACTVTLAPVQQESVGGATFGVQASYAACAVEIRS